jgi:hypothetical protein
VELVQVSMSPDGRVVFTCRVCGERCDAPEDVPMTEATREFLAMHPACSDQQLHADGCPGDDAAIGA